MDRINGDRRASRRYGLHFPLHYQVAQKGSLARFGSATTCDMSAAGLSFRSRKPLPVGAHIEMMVDWPARCGEIYPIGLQVTGFVMRSDTARTAVRVTSRKFRVESTPAESIRVSA
jgi:hypothetical protein